MEKYKICYCHRESDTITLCQLPCSLDKIKYRDSVSDWAQQRISIRSEQDVPLTINCAADIGELVLG
jgi:hypothetical protein